MSQRLLGMLVAVGFALATPWQLTLTHHVDVAKWLHHVEIATVVP